MKRLHREVSEMRNGKLKQWEEFETKIEKLQQELAYGDLKHSEYLRKEELLAIYKKRKAEESTFMEALDWVLARIDWITIEEKDYGNY